MPLLRHHNWDYSFEKEIFYQGNSCFLDTWDFNAQLNVFHTEVKKLVRHKILSSRKNYVGTRFKNIQRELVLDKLGQVFILCCHNIRSAILEDKTVAYFSNHYFKFPDLSFSFFEHHIMVIIPMLKICRYFFIKDLLEKAKPSI